MFVSTRNGWNKKRKTQEKVEWLFNYYCILLNQDVDVLGIISLFYDFGDSIDERMGRLSTIFQFCICLRLVKSCSN